MPRPKSHEALVITLILIGVLTTAHIQALLLILIQITVLVLIIALFQTIVLFLMTTPQEAAFSAQRTTLDGKSTGPVTPVAAHAFSIMETVLKVVLRCARYVRPRERITLVA
jgi:hypothetical protein